MPLLQSPSPLLPRGRRQVAWPVLTAGGAGIAGLLLLAAGGWAEPIPAALAAAAVAVFSVRQALSAPTGREPPTETQEAPSQPRALPFAAMIEALPDPLLLIAAHEPDDLIGRRFVFVNSAARELLKVQREVGPIVTAIRDPDVLDAIDEALFGEKAGEADFTLTGAQARFLRARTLPMGAAADGSRLALLVFRDETESRRVERTRVDFLANASHELRTPLASLSGFIETLRGHARGDEAARDRFLAIMQAQAERMNRLIDDLMSLSRIELNEHVAPHGEVDLAAAVMDVVDALTPLARERGVAIKPALPARGTAVVTGDRDQIVQVVQNLVDNASKYSPRGSSVEVLLELGLTAEAAAAGGRGPPAARMSLLTPDHGPDRFAVLRVGDRGPGIAREHLPRLTERFYRVEGQKSGERLGTGLGLAIVKHIMNRHRGGLAVESLEGEGTMFSAYFPLLASRAGAAPEAAVDVMKVS